MALAHRAVEHYRMLSPQQITQGLQPNTYSILQPPLDMFVKLMLMPQSLILWITSVWPVGIVGRDINGHLIFAEGRIIHGHFLPHLAELIAVKNGTLQALNSGWSKVMVEIERSK